MKRNTSMLYLVAGLLLFPASFIKGQINNAVPFSRIASSELIREHLFLYTDRTIYAVSENVLFKVDCTIENIAKGKPWSTVVYVELIRQDGHSVVQQKLPLSEHGARGNIAIPENVPSGIYFLKAYTKWMRNFTADGYAYKPIKIVNPFTDLSESFSLVKDSSYSPNILPLQYDSVLNCSADKGRYNKREKVAITFSANSKTSFQKEVAISICKKGCNNFMTGVIGSTGFPASLAENPEFFPEPRGISISGKVIPKENGKELTNARVHLAQLHKNSFYTGYIANMPGRFLFTFPYSEGACDFYIEAESLNLPLSLQMESEFCGKLYSPGSIPFELTESESDIASEICINMQIAKLSGITKNAVKPTDEQNGKSINSFYGKPDRVILTKNYVKLTTIREFLFELVPEFIFETKSKKSVPRLAKNTSLVDFSPLCLIDDIPVTDMEKFLNVAMEKIDRIEIIDKAYIAGSLQYNGVIQAFSKSRDLAGIELSKNSLFFKFNLYSGMESLVLPEYSGDSSFARIPDRRNTLYWNPGIKLIPGQEQKISFYTADMNGEYEILIQGVSAAGEKIVYKRTCFVVE